MISEEIIVYLQEHGVPYTHYPHQRAVTAQELAQSVHRSGFTVAKSIVVDADGQTALAVLPAPEHVDLQKVAELLGAREAKLVEERELERLFPDTEIGAEPPFGGLYGLPVVLDERIVNVPKVLVRAGRHDEALEIDVAEFIRVEHPKTGTFGVL